ncbi:GNAT family N-acetyltransferase [Janthinobacterium sp. B9-8]|uniref:GNAT family N-acetyltransferase n=1 Tax=Janthinobacterium sp. B9-8 TaxID=1236179 RepID=UPI00061D34AE|nr:GNAT family N-acetyltransferase [Janthinobacterium sp. B9-8]AMC34608.1 acetyltransferase [Janthinobacterium sp. B9-8]
MPLHIRNVNKFDDLSLLTELIHAAYAPHAKAGLKYWGTHQSEADTAKRLASGIGLIAECDGQYVGTLTLREPQPQSPVALYTQAEVWSVAQFCIAPHHKGKGYGQALHHYAETLAARHGATQLALDTAKPAHSLIALYQSWGYKIVDECDWRPHTNYPSLLLAKPLTTQPNFQHQTA